MFIGGWLVPEQLVQIILLSSSGLMFFLAQCFGKLTVSDENDRLESNSWPESIVVRLHLRGLESFKATAGDIAVEWSVSSTGSHTTRVSLHQGGEELPLDETSPYYSEVRIVGGNGKIPLNDGYVEFHLPVKLLEGNPDEIALRWIDFYRE